MADLSTVGFDPGRGGYHRLSWTETDLEMRKWFTRQAEVRDLNIETDRNGNLWAFLGDPDEGELVATGSHLDSVPNGGAFDGPLGIASAYAALDLLQERGLRSVRPLAIVAFVEEEGSRFGVACLGSRLLTGAIDPDRAQILVDADGITLAQAMANAAADPNSIGPDPQRLAHIAHYVELHIEQGRGLVDLGAPVGLASEIWPHGRWRLDFAGRTNHAGTTRMEDRDDPMITFASTVLRVTGEAARVGARSTFGRVQVTPNVTNAIPNQVSTWLDARAADQKGLDRLLSAIERADVAAESLTPRVAFDPDLRQRLAGRLDQPPVLPTAAGHDAGILAAAEVSTAMLFVRNPSGISHAPEEYASPEDCEAGVAALATVLADLARFR